MDADCRKDKPTDTCEVTEVTKTFGFMSQEGKYFVLDDSAAAKVRMALANSNVKTGSIKVAISGSIAGDTLSVDTVSVQQT